MSEKEDKFDPDKETVYTYIKEPTVVKNRGYYFWIPIELRDVIDPNYKYEIKFRKFKKKDVR